MGESLKSKILTRIVGNGGTGIFVNKFFRKISKILRPTAMKSYLWGERECTPPAAAPEGCMNFKIPIQEVE